MSQGHHHIPPTGGAPGRRFAIALFAAALLICAFGTWSLPIMSHNEARRMVVVQEMTRRHNWLMPTMNGELYIAKPPLFYWAMALAATAFGSTAEGVLRLPAIACGMGLLFWGWAWCRRHAGRNHAAWFIVVLATSQLFIQHTRSAEIEIMLALLNSAALFLLYDHLVRPSRLTLHAAFACLGLAVLTKGPVALVFFIPPALAYGLLADRNALHALAAPGGWATFALFALPWYVYVYATADPSAIQAVIDKDLAGKMKGARTVSPIYKYLLVLLGSFSPWILALFHRPGRLIRSLAASRFEAFCALAAIVPFVIMSAIGEKHGKYILPLYPFFAIIIAGRLMVFHKEARARAKKIISIAVGGALVGNFIFYGLAASRIYRHRYVALRPIAAAARATDAPLFAVRKLPVQLVYYYGAPIPLLRERQIIKKNKSGEKFCVLADSKAWGMMDRTGLCVLREWPVYLKRSRRARLYGSETLCVNRDNEAGAGTE